MDAIQGIVGVHLDTDVSSGLPDWIEDHEGVEKLRSYRDFLAKHLAGVDEVLKEFEKE